MNRFYPLMGIFGVVFYGVSLGLFPLWFLVMTFIGTAVFSLVEVSRLLQGDDMDATVANATTGIFTNWAQTLYERELPKRQNWNCTNCGGPNIQQVKCEWCGMVKE